MNTLANVLAYKRYLETLFVRLHEIVPNAHAEHVHDAFSRRIVDEICRLNRAFPQDSAAVQALPDGPLSDMRLEKAFQDTLEFDFERADYLLLGHYGCKDSGELRHAMEHMPENKLLRLFLELQRFRKQLNPLTFDDQLNPTGLAELRAAIESALDTLKGRVVYGQKQEHALSVHLKTFAIQPSARAFDVLTRKPSKKQKRLHRLINRNSGEPVQLWQFKQHGFNKFKKCEICQRKIYGVLQVATHFGEPTHLEALKRLAGALADPDAFAGLWKREEVLRLAKSSRK